MLHRNKLREAERIAALEEEREVVEGGEKSYIYSTLQASIANCCINLLY